MAEGKKSRKFGRNAKRPSQVRYRTELRLDKNKRLNCEAAEKRRREDRLRVLSMNVPRGTARAKRRAHLQH